MNCTFLPLSTWNFSFAHSSRLHLRHFHWRLSPNRDRPVLEHWSQAVQGHIHELLNGRTVTLHSLNVVWFLEIDCKRNKLNENEMGNDKMKKNVNEKKS